MKNLYAFDLVVLGYAAILTAVVIAFRPPGAAVYLGYHALVVILIALVVGAHRRFGGRFWTFCRYWYVVLIVLASYRELHYLVPQVHPFDDHRYDRFLADLDRRWFGDVDAFFLSFHPLAMDVLHACYWFYFPSILLPGGILYARGEWETLRRYVTVILTGFYVSYLGYLLVPAIGPHHFYPLRPAVLDGWFLGKHAHAAILAMEWRMPDAFPSGHTLMSLLVLWFSWGSLRRFFWAAVVPASGCVAATVALRYHYVVDVLASVALLPFVVVAGRAIHRAWERRVPARDPAPRRG
jgi:hypothetical protein